MTRLYAASGERKYLTPAERRCFFEAAVAIPDLVSKALCLVLIYTGCRISEALQLTPTAIDGIEGNVVFRTLKQRGKIRVRALSVPNQLISFLRRLPHSREQKLIIPVSRSTGWRMVKGCMSIAGLTGIKATPKGLRHAYAIDNLINGADLTKIQKWMGHERLETTKIYLDYIGEEERQLASRAWPDPALILGEGCQASLLETNANQD